MKAAAVSVIIVNYNTKQLLCECVDSIIKHTKGISYEMIVVDNASCDGSQEAVKTKYPEIKLIENKTNTGFGEANNKGARVASGRYLFLFNSDAVLESDCISSLYAFLEKNNECGMAGPRVLLRDRSRQPKICGEMPTIPKIINDTFLFSTLFPESPFFRGVNMDRPVKKITSLGWISGVCMMIRADAFKEVDGFDESIFLYCEDMDLCIRIREKGWEIAHIDDYPIIHKCGGSAKSDQDVIRNSTLQQKNFLNMLRKNHSPLKIVLIKLILFKGLVLRLFVGIAEKAINKKRASLLFETSVARIKQLLCE